MIIIVIHKYRKGENLDILQNSVFGEVKKK